MKPVIQLSPKAIACETVSMSKLKDKSVIPVKKLSYNNAVKGSERLCHLSL